MLAAPGRKLLHELHRREVRADALIRFHDHACGRLRREPARFDRREERLESHIRLPVSIGKRRRDDRRIFVHDPRLLPRHSSRLLRPERAPVKAALPSDDADLFRPADRDAVRAAQLDRALRRLRASRQQEDFFQALRRNAGEAFRERRAFFIWKYVAVQQAAVHLRDDRLAHLRRGVARVGDEHARRPVQPAVAVFVENENVFRTVPDHRRLTAHRDRLECAQLLERRHRIGMRQRRRDAAIFRFDVRDFARRDAEFFAHESGRVLAGVGNGLNRFRVDSLKDFLRTPVTAPQSRGRGRFSEREND